MIDTFAPERSDRVALMNAYFDESMDDGIMIVAGVMLRKSKAEALDQKWKKMMGAQAPSAPYFHMVDVASAGGAFKPLGLEKCDVLARTAIRHVIEEVEVFTAISLRVEDFYAQPSPLVDIQDPYTFACWFSLMGMNHYMDKHDPGGQIEFIFEAGANNQGASKAMMDGLFKNEVQRESYRYLSHGFYPKERFRLLQCADMLAWQWLQDRKRREDGRPRRKDFEEIKQVRNATIHADAEQIARIFDKMGKRKA